MHACTLKPRTVATDCMPVIRESENFQNRQKPRANCVYASCVVHTLAKGTDMETVAVRAHQDLGKLEAGSELWLYAKGNNEADDWAKFAASQQSWDQGDPGEVLGRRLAFLWVYLRYVPLALSKFFHLGPHLGQLGRPIPKNASAYFPLGYRLSSPGFELKNEGASFKPHCWDDRESRSGRCCSVCKLCLTKAWSATGKTRADKRGCPGFSANLNRVLKETTHPVLLFKLKESEEFFIACPRCGAFTQGYQSQSLMRPCKEPSVLGKQKLKRIESGHHPLFKKSGRFLPGEVIPSWLRGAGPN